MVNQGNKNAKEVMSNNGHSQGISDQAPADHEYDNQAKLESCEKKREGGGWITTPFIFGCEAAEGLAGFGARANLISFLTQQMHMRTLTAASVINGLSGMNTVSSLFGAYVADAHLGRFTTIALGSCIRIAGLFTLTIVAWDKTLHPAACTFPKPNVAVCPKATGLHMGILYLAFALMALGTGGLQPCVGPFGASQFDQTHPEERKQLKHYFNWLVFTVSLVMLLASTVLVYIQDNWGWALGFGIPTLIFLVSMVFFFAGMRLYRYNLPQGSPFTRMAKVIVAAIRKRKLAVPEDPSKLYHSGTIGGDESQKLENKGSDDDEADQTVAKLNHGVDDAQMPKSRGIEKNTLEFEEKNMFGRHILLANKHDIMSMSFCHLNNFFHHNIFLSLQYHALTLIFFIP